MLVNLERLQPNPFRDMRVDPIDQDVVSALKTSIERHGFWGGVICRRIEDDIQIAAGHHRVIAAIQAGISQADITVSDDISDLSMIQIYATENATQRGNTGTAQAGSVASAVRFLARGILAEDDNWLSEVGLSQFCDKQEGLDNQQVSKNFDMPKLRGHLTSDSGIGERVICDSGILEHIPGISRSVIREQLANLKGSGEYARIIAEVESELEAEREEEERALEAAERERERLAEETRKAEARRAEMERERQKAEAERQAKLAAMRKERELAAARMREEKARAEEERKARMAQARKERDEAQEREREAKRIAAEERAAEEARMLEARIEAEEARAAQAAQEAELARERERIEKESAEKRRQLLEAERQRLTEATKSKTAAAEMAKEAAEAASRRSVTFDFEGVSKHFKLASHITTFRHIVTDKGVAPFLAVDQQAALAEHLVDEAVSQKQELTSSFIRANVMAILMTEKYGARKANDSERARILKEDKQALAHTYQNEIIRYLWGIKESGEKLESLIKEWPDDVPFRVKEGWGIALNVAGEVVSRLHAIKE